MWSYGNLIKPYVEDKIIMYKDLDDLIRIVGPLFDNLEKEFLEDMKKEMQTERPPVYRPNRL